MRFLHLSSEYPPQFVYGLGRYVNELAEAQACLGHSADVITNSLTGSEHDLVRNGVRVLRVHFPPAPKAPSFSSMLLHFNLQVVERFVEMYHGAAQFDVINAHDWLTFPAAFHLARLAKRPLVTTIHDVVFNKVRGREFSGEDAYVAGIENWACHCSACIVVLSETVRREVIAAYTAPPERVVVIPGGVGIEPLTRQQGAEILRWRAQLASPAEDLLLFVGRLEPEKGLLTLLEAARRLREKRSGGWKLAIAGTGRLVDAVQTLIQNEGMADYARLIGYVPFPELRLAYAAADATIVPSDYEPFGLVALESQRVGTPVIVSMTGGLAETIVRTEGGLGFPPGDAAALAERMEEMLADLELRQKLGRSGQQRVERFFNWNAIARRFSDLCATLSNEPHPECRELPPWKFPHEPQAVAQPLSDLTVIWDAAKVSELQPVLDALSRSLALHALGGTIHVVRAVLWPGTILTPPSFAVATCVRFIDLQKPSDLWDVLQRSAAAIVDASAAVPLQESGLVVPAKIPVIWYGSKSANDLGKWHVSQLESVYALATKLLCDERMREKLAPQLEHKITQVQIKRNSPFEKRVLHVLPQLVTGGAETTLLELVKGSREKVKHAVLSLGPLEGPLPEEFRGLGIPVHDLSARSIDDIVAFIQTHRPSLLHLHSMSYAPKWIPVHRQLAELTIIETEHVVNIGSGHFGPVNHVVCVSKATQAAHNPYMELLGEHLPGFTVIYNGVDLKDYEKLPSKAEARKCLGLPLDRPIIGRVSALARNKMPKEALEVIPILLKKIPNALFVIVGDGPQRKEIESWVLRQALTKSVLFLGERRDIPQVLRAFDVFAYYTTKDALGNVILEAIAAGVPVVTTDIEGTREALDSGFGALVPLGQPELFSAAISDILAKSSQGRRQGKLPKKFVRSEMVRQYLDHYRRLAEW